MLLGRKSLDLLLGETTIELSRDFVSVAENRHLHVLLDRNVGKDAANTVINLVASKLFANLLQFIEKGFENTALSGSRCNEIQNDHRIMLLAVPMNTPHALFQAGRVPRNIVVDHDPAKLEVNTFCCRVSTYHEPRSAFAARLPKTLDLLLTLGMMHPAMDHGDLASISQPIQTAHQEI